MHHQTGIDEMSDSNDSTLARYNFVDDVNVPGFVDEAMFYDVARGNVELSDNETETMKVASRTQSPAGASRGAAATLPLPDFDGAVISVFAVAVILFAVGQAVVVCRQRHRRSCRRRSRKWNVPAAAFGQPPRHPGGVVFHGSPRASEVWTALPPSPLSDLFHADNYRTPAFAYLNRRSTDSLRSSSAVGSRTGSSGSAASGSTAAVFVRAASSSVTWSDVGGMTSSSSPEKMPPPTSLSSSPCDVGGGRDPVVYIAERGRLDVGGCAGPVAVKRVRLDAGGVVGQVGAERGRLDGQAQTCDGRPTAIYQLTKSTPAAAAADDPESSTTEDDVNVTSSASIECSSTHSDADDEVDDITQCTGVHDDDLRHPAGSIVIIARDNDLGQASFCGDRSEPAASPTSLSNSSSAADVRYVELQTDCSTTQPDTDNSTC